MAEEINTIIDIQEFINRLCVTCLHYQEFKRCSCRDPRDAKEANVCEDYLNDDDAKRTR